MIQLLRTSGGNNYAYVVHAEGASRALLVDPVAPDAIRSYLSQHSLTPEMVINTHGHGDHTNGNHDFLRGGGVALAAHEQAAASIRNVERPLRHGEEINLEGLAVEVVHTPGHTAGSICLRTPDGLISGDTVFLAGCGNTKFGGDTRELFESIRDRLRPLPDDLRLWPGHDYGLRNLRFARERDPNNERIPKKIQEIEDRKGKGKEPFSTLGEEKQYNPFFRYDDEELRRQLPDGDPSMSNWETFRSLRALRDQW